MTESKTAIYRLLEMYPIEYRASAHEQKIVKHFGRGNIVRPNVSPVDCKKILICFTNRSGSNFLSNTLSQVTGGNIARENFNYDNVIALSEKKSFTGFEQYLRWIIKQQAQSGIFISKISHGQLNFIAKYGLLKKHFQGCQFILVSRRDILGQAVSFSIANQTKQWTSFQEKNDIQVVYNKQEILKMMDVFLKANTEFYRFFNMLNLEYSHIVYEDFISNTSGILEQLCEKHEVAQVQPYNHEAVKTKKQSDNLKSEFMERFRKDLHVDQFRP